MYIYIHGGVFLLYLSDRLGSLKLGWFPKGRLGVSPIILASTDIISI